MHFQDNLARWESKITRNDVKVLSFVISEFKEQNLLNSDKNSSKHGDVKLLLLMFFLAEIGHSVHILKGISKNSSFEKPLKTCSNHEPNPPNVFILQ